MSAYNPPTRNSVIFNPEYFQTSLANLDTTYLNQNYLRFPFAQGLQNMKKVNITDDTESSDVNSGSLVTSGGVGIGSNVNVGGKLRVNSQNITLGLDAGLTNQGTVGISIGEKSGKTNQGNYSFAMGLQAGETNQSYDCIAIGSLSAQTGQGSGSVAIGAVSGQTSQGTNCVALGNSSGQTSQGNSSIAIGYGAGVNSLGENSIAIGLDGTATGANSIAIGKSSTTSTYTNSVALGQSSTSTSNNQITLGGSSHTQVTTPCVIKTTDTTNNATNTTGGALVVAGGGAFGKGITTGGATFLGFTTAGGGGNRYVEIVADAPNQSYIDFHSQDSRTIDYDARIISTGGTVGVQGATLSLQANKVEIPSSIQMGTGALSYRQFSLGGGNSTGYLWGAYNGWGEGVNLSYNYYNTDSANVIPNTGGETALINVAFGRIYMYTGGANATPSNLGYFQNSSGQVGLGTTFPSAQLELGSDSAKKPTTNTWTISSDSRIKEDITDANLDLCYSIAKNLKLRRFKWKDYIGYEGDKSVVGYIAQEVQEIFPKAVSVSKKILEKKNEDGEIVQEEIEDFLSLNVDQIQKTLHGAIQKLIINTEQQLTQIEQLQNQNQTLERRISILEEMIKGNK